MNKALKIILLLIIAIGWMVCIFKLSGMNSKILMEKARI